MDYKTFLETLSTRLNAGKEDTSEMVSAFCEVVGDCALEGDTITFPGFGSFEPRKRNERITIHPITKKRMLVPPKITLMFKPSTLLKQKVRNNEQ